MHSSPEYKYYDSEIALYREYLSPILTELEKDSAPVGLVIGISAAALVAIAAVAVVLIIKKRKA